MTTSALSPVGLLAAVPGCQTEGPSMRSEITRFAAVLWPPLRRLIAISAFGSSVLPASAADRSSATDPLGSSPMRFSPHMGAPADRCGKACRTWISAVRVITLETAREFDRFVQDNKFKSATLVLESVGGSVGAAFALGRAIRRLDTAALQVPPWESLYALASEELRRMRLTTPKSEGKFLRRYGGGGFHQCKHA